MCCQTSTQPEEAGRFRSLHGKSRRLEWCSMAKKGRPVPQQNKLTNFPNREMHESEKPNRCQGDNQGHFRNKFVLVRYRSGTTRAMTSHPIDRSRGVWMMSQGKMKPPPSSTKVLLHLIFPTNLGSTTRDPSPIQPCQDKLTVTNVESDRIAICPCKVHCRAAYKV
ncbi:hypothetical protein BGZ60DRAFT_85827 [Tricladium varicosporioides]|nr:hypothetical protein BGZ60DRAFT_85827 [Hymenoscyphus varicosporioides]